MSGWDASSRPTWDQQGGVGENTQSFGMPEFPVDGGGFPSSPSPGTPPAIFLQDYDQNDVVQDESAGAYLGRDEFGGDDPFQSGFGRGGPAQDDFGQRGAQGFDHDYGQRGPAQQDYAAQDHQGQDRRGQDRRGQDRRGQDYPAGLPDPVGQPDTDYAARMDPALRDFFAPQPDRPDLAQSGLGQWSPGPRAIPGQGQGQGAPGGAQGYGPPNGTRQPNPNGPSRAASGGRWDESAQQRPGSRSARRKQTSSNHRGGLIAVIVALIVLAAAGGWYLVYRGHKAGNDSGANPRVTNSAPSTGANNGASTGANGATKTGKSGKSAASSYTLTVPRTAGGYHALTSIPSAVMNAAGTTEAAVGGAAMKNGGGKVAGKGVATAYGLSGGQVLTYMGYQGTFDPAKVVANLGSVGSNGHSYSPGPHGGKLACATAAGSHDGTVCFWVTKTTFAVTEYFGSTGPEVVTDQFKAAADTLKLRDSVEVPKA